MVLVEVLVTTLSAIELHHRGRASGGSSGDLLVRGIFVWVGDLGGFAEGRYASTEPCSDEDGGDGGEEDEAVLVWEDNDGHFVIFVGRFCGWVLRLSWNRSICVEDDRCAVVVFDGGELMVNVFARSLACWAPRNISFESVLG